MTKWSILQVALVALVGLAVGCGDSGGESDHAPTTAAGADHEGGEHSGGQEKGEHAEGMKPGGGMDMFASLSPEDARLAKEQGTCPVSGEKLGEMGPPEKATAKGKTVFLCCPGCRKKFLKNPDEYLAKLKPTK